MTKYRIYPYKQGSASAKKFAEALGGKVLKRLGSKYKPKHGDVVINWGAGALPVFAPATILNENVQVAQCKLATFKALNEAEVRVPEFWQNKIDTPHDFFPVVCRTKLRGHSGDGIVIANNAEELVDAPLYTKYVKKKDEYRVHVLKDNPFFIQRKARKPNKVQSILSAKKYRGYRGILLSKKELDDQLENGCGWCGLEFISPDERFAWLAPGKPVCHKCLTGQAIPEQKSTHTMCH